MNDDLLIKNDALKVLQSNRVAIFIVAYNASNHIENVLNRIPSWVAEKLTEIYLIDDSSQDSTVETASSIDWPTHYTPLKIFKTPKNQGYGGNQKIGYSYAIQENFDIVVLLHGDGQYAPEALPLILAKYIDNQVDAVFGSRFLSAFGAIRGGMPIYKFIGNRVLTSIQNLVMGSRLSEWHSGY
jgi:glycosyltransferase involved in cell wall biosynthesis